MKALQMAIKLAEKFVKKVEDGKARSRETYADCKEFLWAVRNSKEPTDLSKFVELYRSFGIECKVIDCEGGKIIKLMGEQLYNDDTETESDKLEGYSGFRSDIEFDSKGKFIKQGFWE